MPVMRYPHGTEQDFQDRRHAGQVLAEALRGVALHRPLVLGLARGGVPVAAEVARSLGAPMRVSVARKIGAPGQPELAIGAVTAQGPVSYDPTLLRAFHTTEAAMSDACERERAEAHRREQLYRYEPDEPLVDRDVVLVDDGLATGATARAAVRMVRESGPRSIVLAVPVGAADAVESLRADADTVVCPLVPRTFSAVGQWYRQFLPTSDDEISSLLHEVNVD